LAGSKLLVISSAILKTLVSFTPVLELYIPEYIKLVALLSSSYVSCVVVDAFTPLTIKISLKSSLILLDSIPLPKEKELYQLRPTVSTSPMFSLNINLVLYSSSSGSVI